MPLLHLFLIAIIQGLTEFLPVSSSGHLILVPELTGIRDQGLVMDVAVHVGTLCAVMLYFRRDVGQVLLGLGHLATRRFGTVPARLALCLIVATIPVAIAGLFLKLAGLTEALRSVALIGWTTLIFGLVLYWADRTGNSDRKATDWTLGQALILGLWQAVALIPGTSRSGIVITGARILGYRRSDAARLAMLMSIPAIIASGTLLGLEVAVEADRRLARDAAIGTALAFAAALLALTLMMRLLQSVSFTPYVIYRVGLGAVLLVIAYG